MQLRRKPICWAVLLGLWLGTGSDFLFAQTEEQIALAQKILSSKKLKFRGYWEHWGKGPYAGDWDRAARELREAGYNALLVNLCYAGQSLYPSKYVPQKYQEDWLKICLDACQKHHLKLHVWVVCYNLGINVPKSHIDKMRQEGRLQKTADGKEMQWLCPSDPRNVNLHCKLIREMLKKYPKIAGIHLDFIRYENGSVCFCDGCKKRFGKQKGQVKNWPADVKSGGSRREEYNAWRKDQIRNLVVKARAATKKARKTVKFSAAVWVGIWVDGIAQDWFPWMKDGLLDFACPMNYTANLEEFKKWVRMQQEKCGDKIPIYPGIAEYKNSLDGVLQQVNATDELGCKGYVIFKLSTNAVKNIIPVMKQGMDRKKAASGK